MDQAYIAGLLQHFLGLIFALEHHTLQVIEARDMWGVASIRSLVPEHWTDEGLISTLHCCWPLSFWYNKGI